MTARPAGPAEWVGGCTGVAAGVAAGVGVGRIVDGVPTRRVLVHASGFRQSPYADIKPAGSDTRAARELGAAAVVPDETGADELFGTPPRKLWHSSPGSSGTSVDARPGAGHRPHDERRTTPVAEERQPARRAGVGTHGSLRTHAVSTAVDELVSAEQARLGRPLRVLDLGGGTGGLAVRLAELGHTVTVLDPSADALAALTRRAAEAGVADRVSAVQGDADTLGETASTVHRTGGESSYDLVCCHGVLEVVDDPAATLAAVAAVLVPGGHLSVTVAGRLAAVLARVVSGDLVRAGELLGSADGRWGSTDPLPRRFDLAQLQDLLGDAGFGLERLQGVRVFGDLVPSGAIDSVAGRAAFLALEEAATTHPEHAAVLGALGAHLHALAVLPA